MFKIHLKMKSFHDDSLSFQRSSSYLLHVIEWNLFPETFYSQFVISLIPQHRSSGETETVREFYFINHRIDLFSTLQAEPVRDNGSHPKAHKRCMSLNAYPVPIPIKLVILLWLSVCVYHRRSRRVFSPTRFFVSNAFSNEIILFVGLTCSNQMKLR